MAVRLTGGEGVIVRLIVWHLWDDPDWRYVAFVLAAVAVGAVPLLFR